MMQAILWGPSMKLIKRQAKGSTGPPTEAATELLAAAASAGCKPRMFEESSDTFEREKRRTIMRGTLEKNDALSYQHIPAFSFIMLYKELIRTNKNHYHASVVGVSSCFLHLSTGVH